MKLIIKSNRIDTLFYFSFIYLGILVDNIVGNQMRTTGQESVISKIYRLIFFVFLLYVLVKRHFSKNINYLLMLFMAILLPFFQSINNLTMDGILTDELYIIKLLFPIYLISAGYVLINDGSIVFEDVKLCLNVMSWVFPLTILVPYVFGIGFRAYSSTGYSGFYSAGNEISIVLGAMFIIQLDKMANRITIISIVGVILSAFAMILTGTKAGYLILVLAVLYFLFRQKFGMRKLLYICGLIILILVFFIAMQGFLEKEILDNVSRLQYKFMQLNRNVFDFIFSNRNQKILSNITKNFGSIGAFLWGWGYYKQVVLQDMERIASLGLIEMDIFDIFCCYGIFVTFFVYRFYFGKLIKNRKNINKSYLFAIVCMLLYSSMAGHTLFSALPGTVLAVLYLSIFFNKEEGLV